ncbi:hypothetical protein V6N13_143516 [Hibiscus sabdariffa]|uniref:BHLH domain-containing protein n=1 Tax=Hibiscus sabdariffa TaxID=183260 RepID=A0ABR2FHP9_9ROSI
MFPLKSFSGVENESPVTLMEGDDSIKALSERKSMEACKSHKEAERRRRQRINSHFSALRSLLPNTTKVLNKTKYSNSIFLFKVNVMFNLFVFWGRGQTDKASLLAKVVHHVRELKRQVEDVVRRDRDGCCSDGQPELESSWTFPGECDEAALSICDEEGKLLKATVCCEDRPGLNHDLSRVIRSVQAKVIRAEMTTVGGRTKSVLVMQWSGDEEQTGLLKRALKDVVENRVSRLAHGTGSKRARIFGSNNETGHGFW